MRRLLSAFATLGFCFAAAACGADRGGSGGDACIAKHIRCGEGFVCDQATATCLCTTDAACGEGLVCGRSTGQCFCGSDTCCTDGYRFVLDTNSCVCDSDACCPAGYTFDAASGGCICSGSDCCPAGFSYNPEQYTCVCLTADCCPPGFDFDPSTSRCRCQSSAACGDGFRCDDATGSCSCERDDACGDEKVCNAFGYCQTTFGCTSSNDCPAGAICNPEQGLCVAARCVIDADCPQDTICQSQQCLAGCRDSGDCNLAEACVDGQCHGDLCDRDIQCGHGEVCLGNLCTQVTGEYCKPCTSSAQCGAANMCLRQIIEGSSETYCGVACGANNSCPNGYRCQGVLLPCNPILGCPSSTECRSFSVVNEPEPIDMCADLATGKPYVARNLCSPTFGSCSGQPDPGDTTRPGAGEPCSGLCQSAFVCADAGGGLTCYVPCSSASGCDGNDVCVPFSSGSGGVCAAGCDVLANNCPADQNCLPFGSNGYACFHSGLGGEGSECDPSRSDACSRGRMCDVESTTCRSVCNPEASGGCPLNTSCCGVSGREFGLCR
jgi:hypothetical protein